MEGDLKDILDGPDTEVEEVETVETPEQPEAVETPETQEKGEKPQETPATTATPAAEPDEIRGLKAALKAERLKRQDAEARAHQQQFDPTVFHQDPASIANYVQQQTAITALNMSREFAMHQFDDYEDMEALFAEEAERNPALIAELRASSAPALFAYKTAKSIQQVRDAQSGALEARIEAKLRAELEAKYAAQQRPAPVVPTDLSTVRSASAPAVADESLDSILKR